jgi:Ca2+-transporting ATPase
MEIIQLLQQKGYVVAMTGDGVNDSPALKKADIGVAMGIKGTDVAQEASDMVLLDDNFSTIVSAVEEGRGIYKNITSFVNYLLSSNMAEVLIIGLSIFLGMPLPITALMLLWINLVTDGLPALALSVDPYPDGLMNNSPRSKRSSIISKSMIFEIAYVSILITIGVLTAFNLGINQYPSDLKHAQTITFTTIVILELVRVYIIRAESNVKTFSNLWLLLSVSVSFILQLVVIYGPLDIIFGTVPLVLKDWSIIISTVFVTSILSLLGVLARKKFLNKI